MHDPHPHTTTRADPLSRCVPGDRATGGSADPADPVFPAEPDPVDQASPAPVAQALAPPPLEPCPAYQQTLDRLLTTGRWEDSDPPGAPR